VTLLSVLHSPRPRRPRSTFKTLDLHIMGEVGDTTFKAPLLTNGAANPHEADKGNQHGSRIAMRQFKLHAVTSRNLPAQCSLWRSGFCCPMRQEMSH
jgi:hypothetical protein